MIENEETIARFFPTKESRIRAAKAIDGEATAFLSRYPAELVRRVQTMKASGLSLKEISEKLGNDPRIPAIAMHLAVKKQAKTLGEAP